MCGVVSMRTTPAVARRGGTAARSAKQRVTVAMARGGCAQPAVGINRSSSEFEPRELPTDVRRARARLLRWDRNWASLVGGLRYEALTDRSGAMPCCSGCKFKADSGGLEQICISARDVHRASIRLITLRAGHEAPLLHVPLAYTLSSPPPSETRLGAPPGGAGPSAPSMEQFRRALAGKTGAQGSEFYEKWCFSQEVWRGGRYVESGAGALPDRLGTRFWSRFRRTPAPGAVPASRDRLVGLLWNTPRVEPQTLPRTRCGLWPPPERWTSASTAEQDEIDGRRTNSACAPPPPVRFGGRWVVQLGSLAEPTSLARLPHHAGSSSPRAGGTPQHTLLSGV